jgi:hypothetical protein
MLFIFSTPVVIRHLWQLKTVVFLHWCLICAILIYTFSVTHGKMVIKVEKINLLDGKVPNAAYPFAKCQLT